MKHNSMDLSHKFDLDIYNINLSLQPLRDFDDKPYRYGSAIDSTSSRYRIELTVDGDIKNKFDEYHAATANGEHIIVITGPVIYQLNNWTVKDMAMKGKKAVKIIISAAEISAGDKILVVFTNKECNVSKSDYLNVHDVYGSPEQFTYEEFVLRAVTAEL